MNFKIENNFLDITNYPPMEGHFQYMAREGWLIHKIFLGSIFIYKRIEPENLDFSITPYEIETAFTRKSKEELEEFNSVCKSVGWNYATKTFDLHIYFKESGSSATPIQTDEEEEFKTLEFLAEKRIKSYYIQIPFLLFFSWILLGGIANNVYSMKDGFAQIVAPLVPIGIIFTVWVLVHTKRFLKRNRKNIEVGKSIEYSDSKFYIPKLTYPILFIVLLIIIIYFLYVSIVLKNKIMLITLIPALIAIILGTAYRFIVKPSKKSLTYKKIGLIVTMILVIFISIWVGIINIDNVVEEKGSHDIEGYKVLSITDFPDERLEDEGNLSRQNSFLVPESYEYHFVSKESGFVITEYGRALTENLAKDLVGRYKRQSKNALTGRYSREVESYFKEGIFDDYLLSAGLSEEDLIKLKDKDIKVAEKAAREIIHERSIIQDSEDLWNVDEAYFLNYEKTEVVLRSGKEVFFLEGKDFSDSEIIKKVKNKLQLN